MPTGTIKSRADFERVFARGRRLGSKLVRVRILDVEGGHGGRVAFVAPKRLGNAVFRNRCKRVLREAARESGLPLEGCDVIMLATRETHDARPAAVASDLTRLLGGAHGRG